MARLGGKVAIVTGAASGIGAATARRFAAEGAAVVLADVNADGGESVAASIRTAGGQAVFRRTDVTRLADLEAAVALATERFGGLDVIHNNAAASGGGYVGEIDPAVWEHSMATMLTSVFYGTRAALPALLARGGGSIVSTASVEGFFGEIMAAPYCTAKAGIINFTRTVALEYGRRGIRANAVCPGCVDTPMLRLLEGMGRHDAAAMAAKHAIGRLLRPEEIANVVLFLASDESSAITGAAIVADGGLTAGLDITGFPRTGADMRVVDADAHVIEGRELVGELLQRFPEKMRLARDDEDGAFLIEGRAYPRSQGPAAGCPAKEGLNPASNPFTVDGVIADADREGIETMVFFPSVALAVPSVQDREFGTAFARGYNQWLAGYCKQKPGRLYGVAVAPVEHVDAAIGVMREAKELGLVATMVPAALRARNLDHPDLEPFWAAAQDIGMPIAIHTAPGIHLPPLGTERFDNYLQVHCLSFPFDMMVATTALVLGGVLERHPKLRVALLESGVGWVPYFFDRMDEHVEKRGRLTPGCKREPREYLQRGQLYVSCEPEESTIPHAVEALGPYFILYASDYPHWDSDFPDSTRPLRERKDISPVVKGRIMGENARVFYGLGS